MFVALFFKVLKKAEDEEKLRDLIYAKSSSVGELESICWIGLNMF